MKVYFSADEREQFIKNNFPDYLKYYNMLIPKAFKAGK